MQLVPKPPQWFPCLDFFCLKQPTIGTITRCTTHWRTVITKIRIWFTKTKSPNEHEVSSVFFIVCHFLCIFFIINILFGHPLPSSFHKTTNTFILIFFINKYESLVFQKLLKSKFLHKLHRQFIRNQKILPGRAFASLPNPPPGGLFVLNSLKIQKTSWVRSREAEESLLPNGSDHSSLAFPNDDM